MRLADLEAVAAAQSDPETWARAWRLAHHIKRLEVDLARGERDVAALGHVARRPVAAALLEYLAYESHRRTAALALLRERLDALEERDPNVVRHAVRWVVETGLAWVAVPGGSRCDG